MEQIHADHWNMIYFGLIFLVTGALIAVVYVLSDATNPVAGLGLFAVYFMAALLGWIAFALQQGSNVPMAVDVPSVASVFNSFILFLAVGQRAGVTRGRYVLGAICLAASLSVFFLRPHAMFATQSGVAALFFVAAGGLSAWRCWNKGNVGDGLIAGAGLTMLLGMGVALYQWLVLGDYRVAQSVSFGVYSAAYVLVALGFLGSVLVEYQQNLSHLAMEDPLTQLLNRRGLENALHIPLAQAARGQAPTAAIMVDVDHFREINANFGNDAGDQVIRQVARYLQRLCRASDVVARTGGDEFLMILPQTDVTGARLLAERLRGEIAERPLVVHQQRIPVTVSLGVAAALGDIDLDKLSQEADRAMHLAKHGGRNRVASVENKPIHLSARHRQA
jgi:diguanylate cyclase (GGDEF)-like protein